jgi:hypothetical protein
VADRSLRWDLIADPRRFNKGLHEAKRSSDTFARGIKRTATLIGGAFAGIAVAGFLKDAIGEAREAAKVGRQTAAVIKATGGVAKVSAGDVDRLADRLSNLVGVDDEIIATGANMLLTFKGVRNEVGKGNDVFNQASGVILDMTAAMHQGEVSQQGLEKSTILVGKALNDPIKGISALTRVGVTFTDAQKDQIKTLVEAGDTMGAQKIILKELGSEFGGAAKAAADPWSRLGVVWGNVKERIGTVLLPALNSVATGITEDLIPAVERFWKTHGPAFRDAFSAIGQRIGNMITKAKEWWETHGPAVRDAFIKAKDEVAKLGDELGDLRQDWDDNKTSVQGLIDTLKPLTDKVLPVMTWLVHRLAADEIGGKFGLIAQLGLLSRTFTLVFKRVLEEFRPFVVGLLTGNHKIIASAATMAEALHLPMAASLRKAEQKMGTFVGDVNDWFNRIDDEKVNVTARAGITWTAEASKFRQAAGRMATGGPVHGPGTATSDSIPRWLSAGEFVVNARSAARHRALLEQINAPGMARGGAVDVAQRFAGNFGGGAIERMAVGLAKGLGSALGPWLTKAMGTGSPAIKAFIRSTDPLNYGWGGAGPNVYDCSGITGAVALAMRGRPYGHGQRVWTTSSIHPGILGLKSGLGGTLQIGVTAGTGHMAGRYGGLGFEAESTRTGIKTGAAASPPESFSRHFHMAKGGLVDERMLELLAKAGADIGGDRGRLRINGKVFDAGGWLMPGATVAVNRTNKPERVMAPGEPVIGRREARMIGQYVADSLRANPPVVNLDRQKVSRGIATANLWEARR